MKIRFLRWVKGLAELLDGIVILVTLGLYDPRLVDSVNEKILFALFGR